VTLGYHEIVGKALTVNFCEPDCQIQFNGDNVIKFSKNTNIGIAVMAVLAVFSACYLFFLGEKNSNSRGDANNIELTAAGTVNPDSVKNKARKILEFHSSIAKNDDNAENRDSAGKGSEYIAIDPFSNVAKSRANLDFETDPFYPKSKEEQNWLDRHGYPNAEQWREYNAASDEQLEQAAANGDTVAETLLNSRRLYAGDVSAETAMLYSAALGNTFALEMLSSSMATGKNGHDPIDGYAFSRVSEMRGNLTLGLGREALFPVRLNNQQRLEAEGRALYYFNILSEAQKEIQGVNAVIVDLRPITITDG